MLSPSHSELVAALWWENFSHSEVTVDPQDSTASQLRDELEVQTSRPLIQEVPASWVQAD